MRTALSRLRSAVGSRLVRTEAGYRLDIEPAATDVGQFLTLVHDARSSEGPQRIERLRRALDLWRGNPYGEFGDEHWALARSVELRTLKSQVVEDLAETLLGVDDPTAATALLRPHVINHEIDERPVGLLMRALAASGKLAEALREFARLSRSLRDVGLIPSGDLRRLEHELLRQHDRASVLDGDRPDQPTGHVALLFTDAVNLAARLTAAANGDQIVASSDVRAAVSFDEQDLGEHQLRGVSEPHRIWQVGIADHPPLNAKSVVPVRLPQQRHAVIGREVELRSIATTIRQSRVVTLTGAGGSGKTALAIAAARESVLAFPAGVYFVDLAPIDVAAEVASAFASAIGLPPSSGSVYRMLEQLPDGDALLVIDNCEHLLDEIGPIVDRIVDRHDDITVLATSREALQVDGERTTRVASLDTSEGGSATRLFVERAVAARQDAAVDDQVAISELCTRLDGMPLAIEMAAARMRSMTLEEIGRRLDNRFRLLSGGTRRARRLQQTLEAVIAWSHDLLSASEQRCFRRLAVFHGGFFVDAVATVCGVDEGAAAELIDGLVSKSLIDIVTTQGDTRFRLLESIRLFALDRLVESDDPDDARSLHANHYADRWEDPQMSASPRRYEAFPNCWFRSLQQRRRARSPASRTMLRCAPPWRTSTVSPGMWWT